MRKIQTVKLPDGSITQINSSQTFTHAVASYNNFFDGWIVRRFEQSKEDAEYTFSRDKKIMGKDLKDSQYAIVSVSTEDLD